jgi:hypothetical protein
MALLPVYVNTYGSCKSKSTAVKDKARLEHEAWLRKNGCHPDQIKSRSKPGGNRARVQFSVPVSKVSKPDLSNVGPTGFKVEEKKYTGREIMGVAVLHKSCMQPVRTKEAAADIARMRRG